MREFNLLSDLPESQPRIVHPNIRTIKNRIIACERGKEFYDGDRSNGYGGYKDDGRWKPVAKRITDEYNLDNSRVLQINCEYGFLLNELRKQYKGIIARGTESSEYALINIPWPTSDYVNDLPLESFSDNSFDLVIVIGPVYAASLPDSITILKHIERISKGHSFITLGAFETEEEERLFRQWTLLGTTILSKSDWIEVLNHVGYKGDYWFHTAKTLKLLSGENQGHFCRDWDEMYVTNKVVEFEACMCYK